MGTFIVHDVRSNFLALRHDVLRVMFHRAISEV